MVFNNRILRGISGENVSGCQVFPRYRSGKKREEAFVADDGCEYSSSCLQCPLPACKYDDPLAALDWPKGQQAMIVVKARSESDHPSYRMIAEGLETGKTRLVQASIVLQYAPELVDKEGSCGQKKGVPCRPVSP